MLSGAEAGSDTHTSAKAAALRERLSAGASFLLWGAIDELLLCNKQLQNTELKTERSLLTHLQWRMALFRLSESPVRIFSQRQKTERGKWKQL